MSELRVELDVELRRADLVRGYLRAIVRYGAGARLLPIVIVLIVLVAADAAYTLVQGRPLEEHHLGFGIALVAVLAIFSVLLIAVSGHALKSLPTPRARYVIDDEAGVHVKAGGREERIPFAALAGSARDGRAYYLYSSRTAFRIIPKRALSRGVRATLDTILVRRLPNPPPVPGGRWVTFAAAAGLVALFFWARVR
jgi:hypothetical protein